MRFKQLVFVGVVAVVTMLTTAFATQFFLSDGRKEIASDRDVLVTYDRSGTLRIVVGNDSGKRTIYELDDLYGDIANATIQRDGDSVKVVCGDLVVEVKVAPVAVDYPPQHTL